MQILKQINMTYENFRQEILTAMESRPKWSRRGQFVFNYVDEHYGVARIAQFQHHIDCFYDDNQIEAFIKCCYEILN